MIRLMLSMLIISSAIASLFLYEKNKKMFYISFFMIFVFLALFIKVVVDDLHDSQIERHKKYANGPAAISANSIGCIKYQYYDDVFYKCSDKAINMIEVQERQGKAVIKKVYPVVDN